VTVSAGRLSQVIQLYVNAHQYAADRKRQRPPAAAKNNEAQLLTRKCMQSVDLQYRPLVSVKQLTEL